MCVGQQTVTTLGDLIAAVTDEVTPLTRTLGNSDILVSYVLKHLVATRRVRSKKRLAFTTSERPRRFEIGRTLKVVAKSKRSRR